MLGGFNVFGFLCWAGFCSLGFRDTDDGLRFRAIRVYIPAFGDMLGRGCFD